MGRLNATQVSVFKIKKPTGLDCFFPFQKSNIVALYSIHNSEELIRVCVVALVKKGVKRTEKTYKSNVERCVYIL